MGVAGYDAGPRRIPAAAVRAAADATAAKLLHNHGREHGGAIAVRQRRAGRWHDLTWAELEDAAATFAASLRTRGLSRGERVCLISEPSVEAIVAYLGALGAGCIPFGIYPLAPAEAARAIVDDAAPKLVVSDRSRDYLAGFPGVVVLSGVPADSELSWETFLALGRERRLGRPDEWGSDVEAGQADDPGMLFYTSGTTGRQKGAQISWRSVVLSLCGWYGEGLLDPPHREDRVLHEIALSSLAGAWFGIVYPTVFGSTVHIAERPEDVAAARALASPTVYLGLPRMWEVEAAEISSLPADDRPDELRRRGFAGMRHAVCGGAPLAPRLVDQWREWGVTVRELYGMTECGGLATIALDEVPVAGVAGKPIPLVDVRIAEDGEILIRGPIVFCGYLNLPEATAAALDEDGWLHSGDLGEFLPDGNLRMLDRKSDVITLSDGSTVIVSRVEAELTSSELIRHAIVVGLADDALGVLIELDVGHGRRLARDDGRDAEDYGSLVQLTAIEAAVAEAIQLGNTRLRERGLPTVTAFRFLPYELNVRDAELVTVNRKVKRARVIELHEALVTGMSADAVTAAAADA